MGRVTNRVETMVDTATVTRWMRNCAATFGEQRDYLTQLDAAIGDADHGANMTRGFSAVEAKLDGLDGATPPGKVLVVAGSTLVSTVGGASGPLWGSALRRAGRALGDAPAVAPAELVTALDAAVAAVVELGAAERGDKTMVDALAPAVDALRSAVDAGTSLGEGLAAARAAAEDGMRATVPMLARKGRASYLGERSIGHQDPGATSTALIIAALEQAVTAAP
jgi:dihydroxyacetone kinase-like protein